MIASATRLAFELDRTSFGAQARIPRTTFSIGIGTPIRPVEQTRTLAADGVLKLDRYFRSSFERASAVIRVIAFASRIPCAPVAAFALPEVTTIARANFSAERCRLIFTGAAQTWFVVNIPATVAGTSETISAISSL